MPVRANVVLAAAVGVIAALAVFAGVVAATRDPVVLDPASPEGVAQAYLAAIARGDLAAAVDQLAEESPCGLDDLAVAYLPRSLQITLDDATVQGDGAVVSVEITEVYDESPFGSSGYTHTERLLLTRQGPHWRVTGSPWPMYGCPIDGGER